MKTAEKMMEQECHDFEAEISKWKWKCHSLECDKMEYEEMRQTLRDYSVNHEAMQARIKELEDEILLLSGCVNQFHEERDELQIRIKELEDKYHALLDSSVDELAMIVKEQMKEARK